MSKYARSVKSRSKHPVATVATPSAVIQSKPIGDSFLSLSSAKVVLERRHADLGSWRILAYELVENVGTLYNVAKHGRKANATLVKKLNHTYGCHLHVDQKLIVVPCQKCGEMPKANHRCKGSPTKYGKHPVTRLSKLTDRDRARREFEAWATAREIDTTPGREYGYLRFETQKLWECWLESRMTAAGHVVNGETR